MPAHLYRFGVFELDSATGELRRKGLRVKLHSQPAQILAMLLERPGQMLTREEICRALWPDGTFVDYDHGVNSAINRLRDALGDKAAKPVFIETLARRGYRFLAPVERTDTSLGPHANPSIPHQTSSGGQAEGPPATLPSRGQAEKPASVHNSTPQDLSFRGEAEESASALAFAPTTPTFLNHFLATPADLPRNAHTIARTLFLLLQLMYLAFYIGALANLAEINDLLSPLPLATPLFAAIIATAALLIPVRLFLFCAVLFRAPNLLRSFLRLWWFLLPLDAMWALGPFLLLHHIPYGLALACMSILVYSPFAQRSLILMGAASQSPPAGESAPT